MKKIRRWLVIFGVIAAGAGGVFLATQVNSDLPQPQSADYRTFDGDTRLLAAVQNVIGSVPLADIHPALEQIATFGTDTLECMQTEGAYDIRVLVHQDFVNQPNAGASILINRTEFLSDLRACLQGDTSVTEGLSTTQSATQYADFGYCQGAGQIYDAASNSSYLYGFIGFGENTLSPENITAFSITQNISVARDSEPGTGDNVVVDICDVYRTHFGSFPQSAP